MSDGFLGRWSKRKLDVRDGKAVEVEPARPLPPPVPAGGIASEQLPAAAGGQAAGPLTAGGEATPAAPAAQGADQAAQPIPLTLDDVKALTAESDFSRFVAAGVSPEVKNAAMKKLFSDPHYNIMDGLDTYIGDYSQPDPIPHAMLRQLTGAKFLGLFDAEEKQEEAERKQEEAERQAREVANNPTVQTVAQSEPLPPAVPEPPHHADPDLRLQQDHATPGEDPGDGAR